MIDPFEGQLYRHTRYLILFSLVQDLITTVTMNQPRDMKDFLCKQLEAKMKDAERSIVYT